MSQKILHVRIKEIFVRSNGDLASEKPDEKNNGICSLDLGPSWMLVFCDRDPQPKTVPARMLVFWPWTLNQKLYQPEC